MAAASTSTTIYILQLKHGKYYIGKSADPARRFEEHRAGTGSAWTKLHPPIRMERSISGASSFDEDRYVKEYMARHGIENVRGGSYASVKLDEIQQYMLQQEIRGSSDRCMRCGRIGHFAKSCFATTDTDGKRLDTSDDDSEDEDDSDDEDNSDDDEDEQYSSQRSTYHSYRQYHNSQPQRSNVVCYNCGRKGHYSTTCYTRK